MKNLTQPFRFLMLLSFVFVWSCKQGDVGPKGDTGASGVRVLRVHQGLLEPREQLM